MNKKSLNEIANQCERCLSMIPKPRKCNDNAHHYRKVIEAASSARKARGFSRVHENRDERR